MEQGLFTQTEILTQPDAWDDALRTVQASWNGLNPILSARYDQVIFTGCGSTYYLSLAAAASFQEMTGRVAQAVPGGELLLNAPTWYTGGKTLLVAISRSGSTTETVRAVEQFKANRQGAVVAITNYGDEPLAALADAAVVIEKGQEQSVAQTRSFASMYVAATAMTALAAGEDGLFSAMRALPDAGRRLMEAYDPVARDIGANLDFDRFYFLGSGPRYGLACEVNLKMKEMTLTHSEPFHFLEFRHGPMSMVNDNAVVVGMLSERNFRHEQDVLNEMRAKGGTILSMGETGTGVAFGSGIPERMRNVLYLPVPQLLALHRSLAKGLNPDRPNNLTAVVKLNL